MKLLLVDGSNFVMRCAYGGELQPEVAVPSATGQIDRAAESLKATHLIICMDMPDAPSWRKKAFPDYKAHRKYSTAPWLEAAGCAWTARGWKVVACHGFEADDLIATLAHRFYMANGQAWTNGRECHVASSDSDLLPLLALGVRVHRPGKLGELTEWTDDMVKARYGVEAARLPHLKALAGESGDNLPGAAGIGEKGAQTLLQAFPSAQDCIAAGQTLTANKLAVKANLSAANVLLTLELATLRTDAPLPPVKPSECVLL